MNKEQSEIFTKIILCAILILILCVLFHVLHSPRAFQKDENLSTEKLKQELVKTQKVGEELDKKYMDDYVKNLETPSVEAKSTQGHSYVLSLPKGLSVVDYKSVKKK